MAEWEDCFDICGWMGDYWWNFEYEYGWFVILLGGSDSLRVDVTLLKKRGDYVTKWQYYLLECRCRGQKVWEFQI